MNCEDCEHYDDDETYPHTGWCELWKVYVKEDEGCDDWENRE